MFDLPPAAPSSLIGQYVMAEERCAAGSVGGDPKLRDWRLVLQFGGQSHPSFFSADQERARIELADLAKLPGGWDGDGAEPINEGAIACAKSVLESMLLLVPAPAVIPNVNGTVSFEWETERGYAHLEFSSRAYSFLLAPSGRKATGLKGPSPAPYARIAYLISDVLFDRQPGDASTTQIMYACV